MVNDHQVNMEDRRDNVMSADGHERLCVRCGYDLRATPVDGVCPECSAPCRWSEWMWTDGARMWRWRIMWGAMLLTAAMIAKLVVDLFWIPFTLFMMVNRTVMFPWQVEWMIENVIPYVLVLTGAYLLTTPLPGTRASEPIMSARRMTRWLVVSGAVGQLATPYVQIWLSPQRAYEYKIYGYDITAVCIQWASSIYPVLLLIVQVLGAVLILYYIGKLMIKFHAPDSARRVRIIQRAVIACLLVNGVWWLVHQVINHRFEQDTMLKFYSSHSTRLINLAIAWGTTIVIAWVMIVLWRVSIRLRRGMSLRRPGVVVSD